MTNQPSATPDGLPIPPTPQAAPDPHPNLLETGGKTEESGLELIARLGYNPYDPTEVLVEEPTEDNIPLSRQTMPEIQLPEVEPTLATSLAEAPSDMEDLSTYNPTDPSTIAAPITLIQHEAGPPGPDHPEGVEAAITPDTNYIPPNLEPVFLPPTPTTHDWRLPHNFLGTGEVTYCPPECPQNPNYIAPTIDTDVSTTSEVPPTPTTPTEVQPEQTMQETTPPEEPS